MIITALLGTSLSPTQSLHHTWRLRQPAPPLPPKPQHSADIKYAEIAQTHLFYPLAFETMGPINTVGLKFISDLSHRISRIRDDPRETSFLFQSISVAIQRFNTVIFSNLFCHTDDNTASLPKHTYRI